MPLLIRSLDNEFSIPEVTYFQMYTIYNQGISISVLSMKCGVISTYFVIQAYDNVVHNPGQ